MSVTLFLSKRRTFVHAKFLHWQDIQWAPAVILQITAGIQATSRYSADPFGNIALLPTLCYQLVLAVNYGQWCPWCRYSVVTSVRPSQTRSPGLASVGQCHGASYRRSIPTSTVHSAAHFLRVPQNNCNTISLNQHIHEQYFVELYYKSYKLQLSTININQIN